MSFYDTLNKIGDLFTKKKEDATPIKTVNMGVRESDDVEIPLLSGQASIPTNISLQGMKNAMDNGLPNPTSNPMDLWQPQNSGRYDAEGDNPFGNNASKPTISPTISPKKVEPTIPPEAKKQIFENLKTKFEENPTKNIDILPILSNLASTFTGQKLGQYDEWKSNREKEAQTKETHVMNQLQLSEKMKNTNEAKDPTSELSRRQQAIMKSLYPNHDFSNDSADDIDRFKNDYSNEQARINSANMSALSHSSQIAKNEKEKDSKPLSADTLSSISMAQNGLDMIESLKGDDKNFEHFGPAKSKIAGVQGMFGNNPNAVVNQQITTITQMVGKFLEGGKLAEGDAKRYASVMPSTNDSPEQAKKKLTELSDILKRSLEKQKTLLSQQGYNTKGISDSPSSQPSQSSSDKVTVSHNGKTFQIPKSRLAEALKDGAIQQ